jgi:hypothetical protein
MTAEIGVLNRQAVALAADSAVTLQLPEGTKIYQTNKLFALSKYEPVGVMIYGNADFMGLPWETIIKSYRSKLGSTCFSHVREYGPHFLSYLESNQGFFSRRAQQVSCVHFVRTWLRKLKARLRNELEGVATADGEVTKQQFKDAFSRILQEEIDHLRRHRRLHRFARVTPEAIVARYRNEIDGAIDDELERLAPLVHGRRLQNVCAMAVLKDLHWSSLSGVVIAGFGKDQVLPSLRCYSVDCVIADKLRARELEDAATDIADDNSATIRAFAQSEMVKLFMNGIDEDFAEYIAAFFAHSFVEKYPQILVRWLNKDISKARASRLTKYLQKLGTDIIGEFQNAFQTYSRQNHWLPVLEIVEHLPKEELAAIAEALVNLTSFKRHVTKQAETVGGPIDVAVISRGDGLVWIKRKHYFSKELNQHFLANYYNDVREGKAQYGKTTKFLD